MPDWNADILTLFYLPLIYPYLSSIFSATCCPRGGGRGCTPLNLLYKGVCCWIGHGFWTSLSETGINSCGCALNRVFIPWTSRQVLLSSVAYACVLQNIRRACHSMALTFKALYWYLRPVLNRVPNQNAYSWTGYYNSPITREWHTSTE